MIGLSKKLLEQHIAASAEAARCNWLREYTRACELEYKRDRAKRRIPLPSEYVKGR